MRQLSLRRVLLFSSVVVILATGSFYVFARAQSGDGQGAITDTMKTDMPDMDNRQSTPTDDAMAMPRLPNGEPMVGMQSVVKQMQAMIDRMKMMMGMDMQQGAMPASGTMQMGMGCMMGMGNMGGDVQMDDMPQQP
ncbi:MAG: hypothetical protein M3Q45_01455 [Chloroflexota bacterium]|nr:hypothetical protein [Chloroflexota bacterium]